MNPSLQGKKVLVTGASSGIGYAAALEFARYGADMAISYNENKAGADDLHGKILALGRECVAVNAVAPGVIDTPFHQKHTPKAVWEKQVSAVPLGPGKPDDVSGAILFLASNAARYITGEVIEVNGGLLMD